MTEFELESTIQVTVASSNRSVVSIPDVLPEEHEHLEAAIMNCDIQTPALIVDQALR